MGSSTLLLLRKPQNEKEIKAILNWISGIISNKEIKRINKKNSVMLLRNRQIKSNPQSIRVETKQADRQSIKIRQS